MTIETPRFLHGVRAGTAPDAPGAGRDRKRGALIALEILLAVGAAGGAVVMFTQGDAMFDGTVATKDLPFESWTVAALSLLVLVAVFPAVVATAAWNGAAWARNIGHLLVAVVLAGWIAVEVVVLGWISWLQPALLAYAAAIAVLGVRERAGRVGPDERGRIPMNRVDRVSLRSPADPAPERAADSPGGGSR
jgi:hypothetical protein